MVVEEAAVTATVTEEAATVTEAIHIQAVELQ